MYLLKQVTHTHGGLVSHCHAYPCLYISIMRVYQPVLPQGGNSFLNAKLMVSVMAKVWPIGKHTGKEKGALTHQSFLVSITQFGM